MAEHLFDRPRPLCGEGVCKLFRALCRRGPSSPHCGHGGLVGGVVGNQVASRPVSEICPMFKRC